MTSVLEVLLANDRTMLLILSSILSFIVLGNPCLQNEFISYGITKQKYNLFETHVSFKSIWKSFKINSSYINIQIPYTTSSNFKMKLYINNTQHISYEIQSNNYTTLSPYCKSIKTHNINDKSPNKFILTISNQHISLSNTTSTYSITCKLNKLFYSQLINNSYHIYIQHLNNSLFNNKPFIITPHYNYGVNNIHCLHTHKRRLLGFGPWESVDTDTIPRSDSNMAVGALNDKIYLVGGLIDPYGLIEINPPEAPIEMKGVVTGAGISGQYGQFYSQFNEIIYMIASDGQTLATWDLSQNILTSPWNTPTATLTINVGNSACITTFENHLYIIGGNIRTGPLADVQVYDLINNIWLSITNKLQHGRYYLSCVVHPTDRMLYALGGSVGVTVNERIKIDAIETESWNIFSDLSIFRWYSRAVIYNDYILVIGGQTGDSPTSQGAVLDIVSLIDINKDDIAPTEKMQYIGKDLSVIVFNDILYSFGGNDGSVLINKYQYKQMITTAPTLRPTRDTQSPTLFPSISPTINTITPSINPTIPSISPSTNPSLIPTFQPSLAPTPNCLSLIINIQDAGIYFDENEFNGLYTYVATRTHFDRPIWEIPQDKEGQNVKYYDGKWIIHGSGYDSLSYSANTYFPPIQNIIVEWIHSNTITTQKFHVLITCVDSYSPTTAPTTAPFDNDAFILANRSIDVYDNSVAIIYVLQNLTKSEYEFIVEYENNNALRYISNIIESHYLHWKYLAKLEYFKIKIEKLNTINITNNDELTVDNVYDYNTNELYLKSELYFENKYEFYLITTSKNIEW
eukprot:240596_1